MIRNTALFLGLAAMALLLWSVSGDAVPEPPNSRGAAVYQEYCYRCHGMNGEGGEDRFPIRDKAVWTLGVDTVISTIAFGARGDVRANAHGVRKGMPPAPYNDADIAEVTMYVMRVIAKRPSTVTSADVARVKQRHIEALRTRLGAVGQSK
jgi:mono/diheme cytochrome c family protein